MKSITKNIGIIAVLTLSALTANAQASASATASATIVGPIAITKITDMNFGNIAVTTAGTVVLSTAGARSVTGGASLPPTTGTVAAALFQVTGAQDYTYAITLPASHTIEDGASHSMVVDNFVSDPAGTGVLTNGQQDLKIGATLNVGAGQAPGNYSSAGGNGFEVTVNYN